MSQNTKYNRADNLTDDLIEKIIGILDGWSGKLTWNKLIEEIDQLYNNRYTRQTLAKHNRIKDAYDATKERVSSNTEESINLSAQEVILIQRVKRLEAENDRLNRENQDLLAQFARWAYNAYSKGITQEVLDKPLTPVDRGKTKTS